MSKIALALLAVAAVVVALALLVFGRRELRVAPARTRTMRGRFLLAVAFFLALFAGYVDRVRAADAPPTGQNQQALSLAEMQAAVQKILTGGPSGNDWMDPAISPNVQDLFEKTGLIAMAPRVECYKRIAVPVKARSEELAALQKQLLDEKVAEGVIPEEVAGKITSIPEPKPGTPAEVRAFQLKVRRVTRQLYAAGELDTATVKALEAAVAIPIADLDPIKALKADVTYALQSRLTWQWSPETRKELLDMLAKQGIINPVKTHRGEMTGGGQLNLDAAREQIANAAKFIADPKHEPKFKDDEGKKPVNLLDTDKAVADYRLKARRAVRILVETGILGQHDVEQAEKAIGVPLFGALVIVDQIREQLEKLDPPPLRPLCYGVMPFPEKSSRLTPAERDGLRDRLADALPAEIRAKIEEADRT